MCLGLVVLALVLLARPVRGQEVDGAASRPRLSIDAALDIATRYVFRGHEKDGRGAVFQPEVGLSYALYRSAAGTVRELALGATTWSSVHAGTPAYPGNVGWFEVDVTLSLGAAFAGGWSTGLLYTSYLAPTREFDDIEELGVELRAGERALPGPSSATRSTRCCIHPSTWSETKSSRQPSRRCARMRS